MLVAAPCLRDIDRCLGPARLDTRSYAAFLVARRILCCVCVRLRPVRHARAHTYPAESWRNRGCVRARARASLRRRCCPFSRVRKRVDFFFLSFSFFLSFFYIERVKAGSRPRFLDSSNLQVNVGFYYILDRIARYFSHF